MYKVDDFAYTVLAQQIQSVSGVGQVIIAGQQDFAVRVLRQSRRAGRARHRHRGSPRRASPPPPPTRPRARWRAACSRSRSTPTTSCSARRATATSSLPSATARRSRSATSPTWSTAPCMPRTGAWYNGKKAEVLLIFRRARRQHHQDRRPGRGLPQLLTFAAEVDACRPDIGPLAGDAMRRSPT